MTDRGQLSSNAAVVYDEFFVPALFAAWPREIATRARLGPGMRVADVACGTGVLALEAAERVAPGGSVVGIDINPGMLAVARGKTTGIDWREAPAEKLPFPDGEFDAVVSQFGLMFFENRARALAEMARVLRPAGHLAVAVWNSLDETPGYARMTRLIARLFGDEVADLLRAPYSLGDRVQLAALASAAGIRNAHVDRVEGEAVFPSIRSWVHTDVRGWTLASKLDDEQFERLVAAAEEDLADLVGPDGQVRFAHPALIVSATNGRKATR
jgi:ubiquinone/menaquinone biosynthesis C-methylase UbiE